MTPFCRARKQEEGGHAVWSSSGVLRNQLRVPEEQHCCSPAAAPTGTRGGGSKTGMRDFTSVHLSSLHMPGACVLVLPAGGPGVRGWAPAGRGEQSVVRASREPLDPCLDRPRMGALWPRRTRDPAACGAVEGGPLQDTPAHGPGVGGGRGSVAALRRGGGRWDLQGISNPSRGGENTGTVVRTVKLALRLVSRKS